jgi:hypothetical protein
MDEACIFASRTERSCDAAMITVGALAPIIPFPIVIIRHGMCKRRRRARHIMSPRHRFSCSDPAGACRTGARRTNGSLVTVGSDCYASRVFPGSQLKIGIGFGGISVTARLPCGGYGLQSTTHWTRSIFESDESTLLSEFLWVVYSYAVNSTPQPTRTDPSTLGDSTH